MKIQFIILFVLVFALCAFGQKTVSDLKPTHAIALEDFLSKNKNFGFLSERAFDEETLKEFRKDFGESTKPYYRVGDFNNDRVTDFALILSRKGKTTKASGSEGTPYEFDHTLSIVIFNGNKKGGFTKSFQEDVQVPLVSFLFTETEVKKPRLYFALYGSDAETMIFTPVAKGYIIEYPEEL